MSIEPKSTTPSDRQGLIDDIMRNLQTIKDGVRKDALRQPSSDLGQVRRAVVSSSAKPISLAVPPVAARPKATLQRRERRQTIEVTALEDAITLAVKNAVPGCEGFVGVFVKRLRPNSPLDANWAIRGIRFGTADREKASKALVKILVRMQDDFALTEK